MVTATRNATPTEGAILNFAEPYSRGLDPPGHPETYNFPPNRPQGAGFLKTGNSSGATTSNGFCNILRDAGRREPLPIHRTPW